MHIYIYIYVRENNNNNNNNNTVLGGVRVTTKLRFCQFSFHDVLGLSTMWALQATNVKVPNGGC